jgi:3-hydroxyisobutyrate dehydrogenase-like beta-hydroxyacid dehydrogenase
MTKRIGFIGLGMMGHGMAKNILAKGFPLTVMAHRNRKPVEDLLEKGATEDNSPRLVAENSDIVFICVSASPQVEEIVLGDGGLLEAGREGLIVVDCTTAEPSSTAKIASALAETGAAMADAPLARTPVEAEAGRLNTMVGAAPEVFATIKPVLETFCENIFHVGELGAGHKLKLINNFLAMGHAALIAEAIVACYRTGVEPVRYYDVVSAGGANSGIFQMMVPKALEGDFGGMKFGIDLARKDLRYYRKMTEEAGHTGQMGDAVLLALAEASNLGYGGDLIASLIEAQAKINNQSLPHKA